MASKTKCPRCGTGMAKDGHANGKQKYTCNNKSCSMTQTTAPIGVEAALREGVDPTISRYNAAEMREKPKTVKRYLVTAAQNATGIHMSFFKSMLAYLDYNKNTDLRVVPYRYHNPTSMWGQMARASDTWAEELVPFLVDRRVPLGDHMLLLGDIKTQPTASRPLEGFETISGARSAIIAHPKLELMSIPTPQQRLPKLLTTTGAVTLRNYIPSKAGKKGEFHHTFGAALVEITSTGGFHLRQINAVKDGSFIDLDREYRPDGTTKRVRASGLVMGDTHVKWVDPKVVAATFGEGGMLDVLRPSELVWHDLHDGYARNHHDEKHLITNYVKHHMGHDDIERELRQTFEFLAKHTREGLSNVVVDSNHPRWLSQWLNRVNPRDDLQNVVFWANTLAMVASTARMGEHGVESTDPFKLWAARMLPTAVQLQTKFLGSDESHTIEGIEVGMHGDRGANGAKGSPETFAKLGVKNITGDGHAPWIRDGAYRVGTSTRLQLQYTHGPSSWLHTHCVIYSSGKRSLLNIIDGNWKG